MGDVVRLQGNLEIDHSWEWGCLFVNKLPTSVITVISFQRYLAKERICPVVQRHPVLTDALIIPSAGPSSDLPVVKKEVIVDIHCGAAVLRGADIFAPGVMGAHQSKWIFGESTQLHYHAVTWMSSQQFNPFAPESDQCQISPPAPPEILHHTVRRAWLFIAYSDERWL